VMTDRPLLAPAVDPVNSSLYSEPQSLPASESTSPSEHEAGSPAPPGSMRSQTSSSAEQHASKLVTTSRCESNKYHLDGLRRVTGCMIHNISRTRPMGSWVPPASILGYGSTKNIHICSF